MFNAFSVLEIPHEVLLQDLPPEDELQQEHEVCGCANQGEVHAKTRYGFSCWLKSSACCFLSFKLIAATCVAASAITKLFVRFVGSGRKCYHH